MASCLAPPPSRHLCMRRRSVSWTRRTSGKDVICANLCPLLFWDALIRYITTLSPQWEEGGSGSSGHPSRWVGGIEASCAESILILKVCHCHPLLCSLPKPEPFVTTSPSSPLLVLSMFHSSGLRMLGVLCTPHSGQTPGLTHHCVPPGPAQSSGSICWNTLNFSLTAWIEVIPQVFRSFLMGKYRRVVPSLFWPGPPTHL